MGLAVVVFASLVMACKNSQLTRFNKFVFSVTLETDDIVDHNPFTAPQHKINAQGADVTIPSFFSVLMLVEVAQLVAFPIAMLVGDFLTPQLAVLRQPMVSIPVRAGVFILPCGAILMVGLGHLLRFGPDRTLLVFRLPIVVPTVVTSVMAIGLFIFLATRFQSAGLLGMFLPVLAPPIICYRLTRNAVMSI